MNKSGAKTNMVGFVSVRAARTRKRKRKACAIRHLGATSPQSKADGQNRQGNGHGVCRIAGRQQERRGEQAQNEEDLLAHGNQADRQIVSADEDEETRQSTREEDQRNWSVYRPQQGYRENRR